MGKERNRSDDEMLMGERRKQTTKKEEVEN